ncbi:tRNA 2-thiouridine(34) synthase MnmA [Patescibacteria group bacterium]|nr:tRNA 2-thiouridine(34) synthase MnmA [Patescibacteria group bacterium]
MKNKKQRIVIAMSGGIDSSVAAALLKRAGFDVIGVYMKFWSSGGGVKGNRCCTPESEKRARQAAKELGIPFYVFNFEKEFKKRIVDYFLKEEKSGRTPNPCVICNKEIKFGLLLKKALKLGADFVATGHYCRKKKTKTGFGLLRAVDKNKDQSYFLWGLNQKQLKHILFPIGSREKTEVRKLAKKFNLSAVQARESQEICFVNKEVNDFLKKHLKEKIGNIVDLKGKILGEHQGLWFYTIGQRRGIRIASGKPYYVFKKDIKKNELVVTQNKKDLLQKELIVKNVNWISGVKPKLPDGVRIKIRYRSPLVLGVVRQKDPKFCIVKFKNSQRAVTPGQSAVFYKNKELLGGGIIK